MRTGKQFQQFSYFSIPNKTGFKAISKVPVSDGCKYFCHDAVFKLIDGDDVEMASESGCDVIPASTRRAHGTHKQLQKRKKIIWHYYNFFMTTI